MEVGMRVVRGPDWKWDNKDGGIGNVGTIVKIGNTDNTTCPEKTVTVVWDNGTRLNCRAGSEDSYDLRVVDSAQTGVRHSSVICDSCKENGVFGFRWKCTECFDFDLCSNCYFSDKHELEHKFTRIDVPSSDGIRVPERKGDRRLPLKGIFKDATVVRGSDWSWGNQDGEKGGKIVTICNWNDQSARNAAQVAWLSGKKEIYRLGCNGKVDLKCTESSTGGFYYPNHLPVLGRDISVEIISSSDDDSDTNVNEVVKLIVGLEILKKLQNAQSERNLEITEEQLTNALSRHMLLKTIAQQLEEKKTINELRKENEDMIFQSIKLDVELENKKKELAEVREYATSRERIFENTKYDLEKQIKSLKEENADFVTHIEQKTKLPCKQCETHEAKIIFLEKQMEDGKKRIIELEKENEELQSSYQEIVKEMEMMIKKTAEQETSLNSKIKQEELVEERLKKIDAIEKELRSLQYSINDRVEQSMTEGNSNGLNSLQEDIQKIKSDNTTTQQQRVSRNDSMSYCNSTFESVNVSRNTDGTLRSLSVTSMTDERSTLSMQSNQRVRNSTEKMVKFFYDNNMYTDIDLIVKIGESKKSFPCHKLMLSIRSPYFAAKFKGKNEGAIREMEMFDVSPSACEALVKFCYGEKKDLQKNRNDVNFLLKVIKAAKKFEIEPLKVLCCDMFNSSVPTKDNVFEMLDVAIVSGSTPLKLRCEKFLQCRTAEVLSSQIVSNVTPEIIDLILNLPTVALNSEYELLNWVFEWGSYKHQQNPESNFKEIIKNFLPRMNFVALTTQQFEEFLSKYANFFDANEGFAIYRNIVNPGCCPLPTWCNKNKVQRSFSTDNMDSLNSSLSYVS